MSPSFPSLSPRDTRSYWVSVAPRYDLMNTVMTLGLHYLWRRQVARVALSADHNGWVLDLGCGTGDMAFAMMLRYPLVRVVGVDPALSMLSIAVRKAMRGGLTSRFIPVVGDGVALPFPNATFSACVSAFVLRNTQAPLSVLQEMGRVLVPGGRLAILELCQLGHTLPERVFAWYLRRVVPLLGRLVTGHREAYNYFVRSIWSFPTAQGLVSWVRETGFAQIEWRLLGPGLVLIGGGMAQIGPLAPQPLRGHTGAKREGRPCPCW